MWSLNFSNEINFKGYKIFLKQTKNEKHLKLHRWTKGQAGEAPAGKQRWGFHLTFHAGKERGPLLCLDLASLFFSNRLWQAEVPFVCWETHQMTLSAFTSRLTVVFRSSTTGNISSRIHLTTSMKNSLWISSVSASWRLMEFKMRNAFWKSDKVRGKRREKKKRVKEFCYFKGER